VIALAEDGHKVVACAWRVLDGGEWAGGEPTHGYRFAGLLAFEDPVREGVADAIAACRDAGIHIVMVTGDHPVTARAVAREIGLGDPTAVIVSASDMETRLESGAGDPLRDVDVVARAVPSQKLMLVRALQDSGEIVAVTGDGVNDVPALQAADIGIAMGERGTRSAREVAAIVLLDDNFRTIVGAISEGRQLFRNLQLSFAYLLMVHIPLVTTAALIPLAGYPMLYLPIHIVWLELVIHPTALLVFQDLPPLERLAPIARGRGRARFFGWRDVVVIGAVGMLITALITLGFGYSVAGPDGVEHARALAVAGLTFASAALTAALSRLRTWVARSISGGTVALSILLIQTPPLARLLHMQPLHSDDWGLVVAASALPALLPLLFAPRG
jgi:Ca2+-transporting ATPase